MMVSRMDSIDRPQRIRSQSPFTPFTLLKIIEDPRMIVYVSYISLDLEIRMEKYLKYLLF